MSRVTPAPGRLESHRVEQAYQAGFWHHERVTDQLLRHANERPEAVAIVDGEYRLSWGDLAQRIACVRTHLRDLGLTHGDVVALQLPNWHEYTIAFHALQQLGCVVLQLGADWKEPEMEQGLDSAPAKAIVSPAAFAGYETARAASSLMEASSTLEHVIVVRGEAPTGCHSLDEWLSVGTGSSAYDWTQPAAPDEVVRLVFTSGTTGRPKPIMHTHNTTIHSSRTLAAAFKLSSDDVLFSYVPLSTNYGAIMGLFLHALTGATLVYMDKFSASGTLELVERENITFLPGTPTAFMALTNSPALSRFDTASLKVMISAGSSFPVQAIRALRAAIPSPFIESYGMNEFGMGFWCSLDDDEEAVIGSIGRPIPGLEARVVDTNKSDVAAGETGELIIQSAGLCAGYHGRPEANAESWDNDGWFYTGDLASVNATTGAYHIVGRSKEVIIRGGANVSPREVEEALVTDPRVREAAVIGLPDDYYGETVCACVIANDSESVTDAQLIEYLRERLAGYKVPTRVEFVDAFPLNAMGKVQKRVLVERFS